MSRKQTTASELQADREIEPSESFWDAIISGGSPSATCDFCQRVHFDGTGDDMDEGELDAYELNARKEPDKFIACDGSVRYGEIEGKRAVYGCPCNRLSLYEQWIWANRYLICTYIRSRARLEVEEATLNAEQCKLPTPQAMPDKTPENLQPKKRTKLRDITVVD